MKAIKIKATHVIIGGIVFPWAAKAPYVASGNSTLGALEYNQESDVIKCHACGAWFTSIRSHIKADGVSIREYRQQYGFNSDTPLSTPRLQRKVARRTKRDGTVQNITPYRRGHPYHPLKAKTVINTAENKNLKLLCQAQIRVRVLDLAKTLGTTPTIEQLSTIGLHPKTCKRTFGMRSREFLKSIGLEPNGWGAPLGNANWAGQYIREASE